MEQGEMSEPEDGEILDENEESAQGSGTEGEYEHRRYSKRSSGRKNVRGSQGRSRADQQPRRWTRQEYHRIRSQGNSGATDGLWGLQSTSYGIRTRSGGENSGYVNHGSYSSKKLRPSSSYKRSTGGPITQGSRALKSSMHSIKALKSRRQGRKVNISADGDDHDDDDIGDGDGGISKLAKRRTSKKNRYEEVTDNARREFSSKRGRGNQNRSFKVVQYHSEPHGSVDHSSPSIAPAGIPPVTANGLNFQNDLQRNETEPVSDDDSSVLVVPESELAATKKSPLIITLDTTDTSEDEEAKDNVDIDVPAVVTEVGKARDDLEKSDNVANVLSSTTSANQSERIIPPDVEPQLHLPVENTSDISTPKPEKLQEDTETQVCDASTDNNDDDEDIYELELRNQLLADLVEKTVKQESSTTSAAAQYLLNSSNLQVNVQSANSNLGSVSSTNANADDEDEEEIALREVLISQMANKKKKQLDEGGGGISYERLSEDDTLLTTPASPLRSLVDGAIDPVLRVVTISEQGMDSIDGPRSPNSVSPRYEGKHSIGSTPSRKRDDQSSATRGRRTRNSNKQRSRHKSDGPPIYQSNVELQHRRMVRVENEPLRNPPHTNSGNWHPNVRALPDNDLRNKLLQNRRNEQLQSQERSQSSVSQSVSLSLLFPEFGIADTDMRQEMGKILASGSDMTIRRTVSFDHNPTVAATSSSTSITYMAPINVNIPADHVVHHLGTIDTIIHSAAVVTQNSPYMQPSSPLCITPLNHQSPGIIQPPFSSPSATHLSPITKAAVVTQNSPYMQPSSPLCITPLNHLSPGIIQPPFLSPSATHLSPIAKAASESSAKSPISSTIVTTDSSNEPEVFQPTPVTSSTLPAPIPEKIDPLVPPNTNDKTPKASKPDGGGESTPTSLESDSQSQQLARPTRTDELNKLPAPSNTVPVPKVSPTGLKVQDSPLLSLCSIIPFRESTFNHQKKTPPAEQSSASTTKPEKSTPKRIVLSKTVQEPLASAKATMGQSKNGSITQQAKTSLSKQGKTLAINGRTLEEACTHAKLLQKEAIAEVKLARKRSAPVVQGPTPQKRPRNQAAQVAALSTPLAKTNIPSPTTMPRPPLKKPLILKPPIGTGSKSVGQRKPVIPIVVPVVEGDTTEDEDDEDCRKSNSSPDKNRKNKNSVDSNGKISSVSDPRGMAFQSHLDLFLKQIRQNVDELESGKNAGNKKTSGLPTAMQDTSEKPTADAAKAEQKDASKNPESTSVAEKIVRVLARISPKSEEDKSQKIVQVGPSAPKPTNDGGKVLKAKMAAVTKRQPSPVSQTPLQVKKKAGNMKAAIGDSEGGTMQTIPGPLSSVSSSTAKLAPSISSSNNGSETWNSKAATVIETLTQRVMETKEQITLSFKEKELLQNRQSCYDEYKSILRDLQHHTRLTNYDAKLGQDISDLEKKLAGMKKKRETVHLKALDLNRTIRENSKTALTHKKACLLLANDVKTLGDKIIGSNKYKVPDILVENINELIRNMKTMDEKQDPNLQRERGVIFKQLTQDEGTFRATHPTPKVANTTNKSSTSVLPQSLLPLPATSSSSSSLLQVSSEARKRDPSPVIDKSVVVKPSAKESKPVADTERTPQSQLSEQVDQDGVNEVENKATKITKTPMRGAVPAVRKILITDECRENEPEEGKQEGEEPKSPGDRLPLAEGDILSATVDVFAPKLESVNEERNSLLETMNQSGIKLDPHTPICPASLYNGICTKEGCKYQHI